MGRRNSHDDFGGSFIQRTLAALTSPFRGFMDDAFSGRSGIRSDRTFGQQLLHWLTSPLRFLTGFAVFLVQAWASSRSGWKFLLGLPSLAVIAVFLLGVWFVGYYPNRIYGCAAAGMAQAIEMINDREARDRGRVQNVKFAEALVRMRPESEPDKYRLGMAAARDEEIPFASDVMRKLAPDDSVGLSDAHLWRAAYFQNEKWFQGSDDQRDSMVLKHLDMAIEQSPDNKRAHEQMSEIQIRKAATFDEGTSERREFLEKGLEHSIAMVQGGIRTQSDLLAILRIIRLNKELFGLKAARKQFDRMETNLLAPLAERAPNVFEVWMVLVSCGI